MISGARDDNELYHRLANLLLKGVVNAEAVAIVTYPTTGSTTLRAARERPEVPILCLTAKIETARRLTLSFGVHAAHVNDITNFNEMVDTATAIALRDGLARDGQSLVVTAGVPFGVSGSTNILRIAVVTEV